MPCVIVLHDNHANDIEASLGAACARLRRACATLLNQRVLLKAVNDGGNALAPLTKSRVATRNRQSQSLGYILRYIIHASVSLLRAERPLQRGSSQGVTLVRG